MTTRVIICRWCGTAIEPNAARYRLFQSRSTKAVGRWIAHSHPSCGRELLKVVAAIRGVPNEALGAHYGDPCAVVTLPPRGHVRREPA